ncbi:MAG: ABC transporter permease [Hyphomicrobiaceae bacterium]
MSPLIQALWTHFKPAMRWLPVWIPYTWMLIFFLIPFLIVFKISISTPEIAQPPYTPSFDVANDGFAGTFEKTKEWTLDNYRRVFGLLDDEFASEEPEAETPAATDDAATTDQSSGEAGSDSSAEGTAETPEPAAEPAESDSGDFNIYIASYFSSLWIAFVSTALTLLIGYPIAYGMARAPLEWRPTLLMAVILPFWTSQLIRVYAWIGILSTEGLLNRFLMSTGLISEPLVILQTNTAVYIGIVYSYLPFMILPLYSALEKMDDTLLEAASDLGCPPLKAFWQITFPLSLPGVIAGCFLVFIPAVGEFVIPDLLGGSDTLMIGKVMWEEFFNNRDWPAASAVAVVLLLILVIPIVLFQNQQQKTQGSVR